MQNRSTALNYEQNCAYSGWEALHDIAIKSRDLTSEQMASVPCPTCGAAIGEDCELNSGALRFEPHRDRRLAAADALEAKPTNNT
jgi:hypothetical protein